jgi:hypothetical protein
MWDWIIRLRRVSNLLPLLETILAGFGEYRPAAVSVDVGLNVEIADAM